MVQDTVIKDALKFLSKISVALDGVSWATAVDAPEGSVALLATGDMFTVMVLRAEIEGRVVYDGAATTFSKGMTIIHLPVEVSEYCFNTGLEAIASLN